VAYANGRSGASRGNSGPPDFLPLAVIVAGDYDALPRCELCGRKGLNWGEPAQPRATGGYAHVGCLADFVRAAEHEIASLASAFEAQTP
jgi:hypothetical protein